MTTQQTPGVNYDFSFVTEALDPLATGYDVDGGGKTDAFLSFSVDFSDVVDALSLRGISVDQESSLNYVVATSTQADLLNMDLCGVTGGVDSIETFQALGAISDAASAINLLPVIETDHYAEWCHHYSLVADSLPALDADGDGVNNSVEYAMGGDPLNAADRGTGYAAPRIIPNAAGSVEFVFSRRIDAAERGIIYRLETSDSLSGDEWTTAGYIETGSGALDAEFEAVTNTFSTVEKEARFFRLQVETNL
jgi:hypothetical protein